MAHFTTMKRWRLKDGADEQELVRLVKEEIAPHYKALSAAVKLALWRIENTNSYFALQHWNSRSDWEAATTSSAYREWYEQYRPILARWDEIMEFEDECNTVDLLSDDAQP